MSARLLRRWSEQQDIAARDQLLALLYAQLRGMAVARLGLPGWRAAADRARARGPDADDRWADRLPGDRVHFLSLAALKMRSVLVDHARAMAAQAGWRCDQPDLSYADREAS